MSSSSPALKVTVGACAAAVVVGNAGNKTSGDEDAKKCITVLSDIGVGPNDDVHALAIRFVSRLRANYDLTLSGIMSESMAANISDELDSIDDLLGVEWSNEASLNVLQSIKLAACT